MGRRLAFGALLAISLARCLFPPLDALTSGDASASEAGAIAFVQQNAASTYPPVTATLPAAITAGDTLVVCAAFPIDFGSLQVSDTLARAYTLVGTQDGVGIKAGRQVCFASIGGAGGNDTISLTTTKSTIADGATHEIEAYVLEYSGIAAIDAKLSAAGMLEAGVDASLDAGSITASAPNELLFAWLEAVNAGHLEPSFSSRTTFDDNNVGDKLVSAPGSYPVTGGANNNWVVIAATFKGF